jgi:hypothetical protein
MPGFPVSPTSPTGRRDQSSTTGEDGDVTATPSDESVVEAICAALAPYPWRRLTPERLARLVLAAGDRRRLEQLLGALPGVAVGAWERLEPTSPDDPRLEPLLAFLASHRWTELTLVTLCRRLVAVLAL